MIKRATSCLFVAAIVLAAVNAAALGPHEVLLLVNTNSQQSVTIAFEFARLRHVPESNVVLLGLPVDQAVPPVAVSRDYFTQHIWLPANKAVKERGIGDHILAWIYSVDFPVEITANPPISIEGLTFTRNNQIGSALVSNGEWQSPLFAAPANPQGMAFPSQSFDVARGMLGDDMPLPSMMLGFAGQSGNSLEVIHRCIENGVQSDRTHPRGTIYFVTGEDIRAKARSWQFEAASDRLSQMGVASVITNATPHGKTNILGMLVGLANVAPLQYGRFLPGSMADHLTSCAGDFKNKAQTKLTAWIDAGAGASAGTVTEPKAIWMKFPSAWTYVHYAAGCTAIESLYQGVSCPLQILLVGEPLACPWAPDASVELFGLDGEVLTGSVLIRADVTAKKYDRSFVRYAFLLDGRTIPGVEGIKAAQARNSNTIEIDTSSLPNGSHTLRVVAYSSGSVRSQVFVEKAFVVKNGGGKK